MARNTIVKRTALTAYMYVCVCIWMCVFNTIKGIDKKFRKVCKYKNKDKKIESEEFLDRNERIIF